MSIWKRLFLACLLVLGLAFIWIKSVEEKKAKEVSQQQIRLTKSNAVGMPFEAEGDKGALHKWNVKRLANPKTGKIPRNVRRQELDFLKQMNLTREGGIADSLEWVHRGPFRVGGRTRAFAIDVANENVMIAIGVSGNVWRTEDGGQTWNRTSDPQALQGATAIAQDTREGHTNTWYYTTGEGSGNSAAGYGAYYFGAGVYKSTDNGLTWNVLESTVGSSVIEFDSYFDISWNIATDPAAPDSLDVIYLANYGRLHRSEDGGESWKIELSHSAIQSPAYYTNVEVSSTGIVYATVSSDGGREGIWRSENGKDYTNILPDNFPPEYGRTVIGINPSNENEVYFLFTTEEGYGKETYNWRGEPEWNALWKYTYIEGDGTGEGGEWLDLSENIPNKTFLLDGFNAQGGYNLFVKVKPDDPNTIFIGGTNIFRSTDGFTTPDNTSFIGGYKRNTDIPAIEVYPNHHPDQHEFLFLPSDPNTVISVNDGGIAKTTDILADSVAWESLNNGYVTTQFYTIIMEEDSASNVLMGGLQDNGTFHTRSGKYDADWVMSFSGDGSYGFIPKGKDYYILSLQLGRIFKVKLDENLLPIERKRIDPIGPDPSEDYLFIHPFELDPFDNNVLYLMAGNKLYINYDLDGIPFDGGIDSISTNWTVSPAEFAEEDYFSSIAVCNQVEERIYLGTEDRTVYRIDNVQSSDPIVTDVTGDDFPSGGFVAEIAIDPSNNDNLFVLFSDYEVYSLYYSENAGGSWAKVAGNLESSQYGIGEGPSFRSIAILPVSEDSTAYFVGTSVGLFYTGKLDSLNTVWTQLNAEEIGASVVEKVRTRISDGLIVAATHGNGMFSANTPNDPVTPMDTMPDTMETAIQALQTNLQLSLAPNPVENQLNVHFNLIEAAEVELWITSQTGSYQKRVQSTQLKQGPHGQNVDVSDLPAGLYHCSLQIEGQRQTVAFVKQ